jgi:hypothetical protein
MDATQDRELVEAIASLKEMAAANTKAIELLAEILERRYPDADRELISLKEAAKLLNCTPRSLSTYRQGWIEGVHFFSQDKGFLYNRSLLADWLKHRFEPAAHQRAIELWLQQQPQNQARTKGRKASNKE